MARPHKEARGHSFSCARISDPQGRRITAACLPPGVPFQQCGPSRGASFAKRHMCLGCTFFSLRVLFHCAPGGINDVAGEVISPSLSPHRRVLHAHVHAGLSRVGQRLKERLECNCGPACVICVLSATERRGVLHFNIVLKRCLRQTGNSIVPIIVVCQLYWKNVLD